MAEYLSEQQLRTSVERLGRSSAKGRMCEFLIGLRALKLAAAEEVAIAESVDEFIQALDEYTLWASDDTEDTPYFNPFGRQAGFKSRKFRSNGPANTIHGWATQANSPFEIFGERPKAIRRRALSSTQLRAFLIQSRQEAYRPLLLDVAVWFFRTTDFGDGDRAPDSDILTQRFVDEAGLTPNDVEALFRTEEGSGPGAGGGESATPLARDASEDSEQ